MTNHVLFNFEFKNLNMLFVQRTRKNIWIANLEIHATCPKGEEFLANNDNYEDCFQAGRAIFINLNTEILKQNVQTI
jgi:hypothetical protein